MEAKTEHEMEAGAMGLYRGCSVEAGISTEILILDFLYTFGTRFLI